MTVFSKPVLGSYVYDVVLLSSSVSDDTSPVVVSVLMTRVWEFGSVTVVVSTLPAVE